MREPPDCIVFSIFKMATGLTGKATSRAYAEPVVRGGNKAAILAAREMLDSAFRQNFDDFVPGI
jgi:hypothetical protein